MPRIPSTAKADGVFDPRCAYSFSALQARGFKAAALREMQRRGLAARRAGRLKVVLGADLMNYFESLPVDQLAAREGD